MNSRAYVTLVNDSRYVPGAVVLARSLLATSTRVPLVMIVHDLTEEEMQELGALGATLWEAPPFEVQTLASRNFPSRSKTFAKINAWLLTQFEKCVFLDSDIVVEDNIDRLFDYPEFSAVGTPEYFNTGVFVFKPSQATHRKLIEAAQAIADDPTYDDDSEQEMLQRVFRSEFRRLPKGYNYRPYHRANLVRRALVRRDWWRRLLRRLRLPGAIYVIHFIGYPKPWEYLLPEHARHAEHYTWTPAQIAGVEWSFEVWRRYWRGSEETVGEGDAHVPRSP